MLRRRRAYVWLREHPSSDLIMLISDGGLVPVAQRHQLRYCAGQIIGSGQARAF
jgi:hypothetical protein